MITLPIWQVILWSLGFVVLGVSSTLIWISRDPRIMTVDDDEMLIKKPREGLVLAQVTPEVLRQMVALHGKGGPAVEQTEARFLTPRQKKTAYDL